MAVSGCAGTLVLVNQEQGVDPFTQRPTRPFHCPEGRLALPSTTGGADEWDPDLLRRHRRRYRVGTSPISSPVALV